MVTYWQTVFGSILNPFDRRKKKKKISFKLSNNTYTLKKTKQKVQRQNTAIST